VSLLIFSTHLFGKDHWSTFLYVASCVTGRDGFLDTAKMRCDPGRHPQFSNGSDLIWPTRLFNGKEILDHDDWDCLEDLEAAELIVNIGTGLYPQFDLTVRGWVELRELQQYHQAGGRLVDYIASEFRNKD